MTAARRLLVPAAALLLGGCWWEGPPFYPPDAAAAGPLPDGSYIARSGDGDTGDLRLRRAPDGGYVDQDGKHWVMTPFADGARALWIVEYLPDRPGDPAVYGLAEREGDGVHIDMLECAGAEAIVRAAGGRVTGDAASQGGPLCAFDTRAQLESALHGWLAAHPRVQGAAIAPKAD